MNILSKEQISNLPEWLPIEGFPKYEVNCMEGLVRNVKTLRVLKASPDRDGYPRVGLYKERKLYSKMVHRIVAESAFSYYNIQTDGLLVLHLDETRTNSGIDNLALGTNKENMNFPKAKQRKSDAQLKKAVGAYKNGELVMTFQSTMEASRNGFCQSIISDCCLGKRNKHKGYNWKYLTA